MGVCLCFGLVYLLFFFALSFCVSVAVARSVCIPFIFLLIIFFLFSFSLPVSCLLDFRTRPLSLFVLPLVKSMHQCKGQEMPGFAERYPQIALDFRGEAPKIRLCSLKVPSRSQWRRRRRSDQSPASFALAPPTYAAPRVTLALALRLTLGLDLDCYRGLALGLILLGLLLNSLTLYPCFAYPNIIFMNYPSRKLYPFTAITFL